MTYPFQIIRVNTKTKNGLELFHESKHIINGEILEKTKLKVIEIKNSALIVQRLNENGTAISTLQHIRTILEKRKPDI